LPALFAKVVCRISCPLGLLMLLSVCPVIWVREQVLRGAKLAQLGAWLSCSKVPGHLLPSTAAVS